MKDFEAVRLRERAIAALYRNRQVVILAANVVLLLTAYWAAFALRFDFEIPPHQWSIFVATAPVVLLVKVLVFSSFRLNQGLWRYVSVSDLECILKAAGISAISILAMAYLWEPARGMPRSVPLVDFVLTVGLVGGVRFSVRIFRQAYRPERRKDERRVLVVGAGDAGEQTLREIRLNPGLEIRPVGLVDDDPRKRGATIHGVGILGTTGELDDLVRRLDIDEILIAIPSATGQDIRRIVERCEAVEVQFKVLPAVGDLIAGRVTVRQYREIQIEDLLGRENVLLDGTAIEEEIVGRTVLVTGAAGSIGSELARQVAQYRPANLILLDRSENGLFYIDREIEALGTCQNVVPIVGDIQHQDLLDDVFSTHRPSLVYHAAAYKHVPLMEISAVEAIRNNVLGTRGLMDISLRYEVDRFVLISTDKAVKPRNVMGATKRLAELVMLDYAGRGMTKFSAVRFGNVLGSAGSVVPIFREQLKRGGPLTVTDPDATRYFMTIPEAVQLVMQSGAMGNGGEIFVLDMGTPVRIVDLARRMITLSGKKPDEDIDIVFTGLRAGEKIHEELFAPGEQVRPTAHEKVRMLVCERMAPLELHSRLHRIEELARARAADPAREALLEAVASREDRVVPASEPRAAAEG